MVTGKHPTWARILPKGIKSTTPVEPSWNAFLAKQKESLDRKKRRAASVPPTIIMPQVQPPRLQFLFNISISNWSSKESSNNLFLVLMLQKSQDVIEGFLKRMKDEVSERALMLEKKQEEFMAEVCLSTAFAKKLHSRENVQPSDFLDRSSMCPRFLYGGGLSSSLLIFSYSHPL